MTMFSKTQARENIIDQMLTTGKYLILDEFVDRESVHNFVKKALLEAIKLIEGQEAYLNIKKNGLERMHKYFPADKLVFLEKFVREKVKTRIIKMAYDVGKTELLLEQEFFINSIVLLRIKYPFVIGIKSNLTYEDYIYQMYLQEYSHDSLAVKLSRKIKSTSRKVWKRFLNSLNKILGQKIAIRSANLDIPKSVFEYNSKYPYAAFAHGPHLDSWFAAPYSLEFWLSVTGVRENNGLLFYPETFGSKLACMDSVPFVAPGIKLPKPQRLGLKDGSLIIFNGELLHGTQLNVSDVTRIGISVNISPHELYFSPDRVAGYNTHFFHSSTEIERGNFENLVQFKISDSNIKSRSEFCRVHRNSFENKSNDKNKAVIVKVNQFSQEKSVVLCSSREISIGEKRLFHLNFGSRVEKIILVRTNRGFNAISAICPHLATNLIDAYHDEQNIYCPGHGLTFRLADGLSECSLFKLKNYQVIEDDNGLVILSW